MTNTYEITDLAGVMYTAYCVAVGGKAFNGEPLPTWPEFQADPKKLEQVTGWLAVAEVALNPRWKEYATNNRGLVSQLPQ